MVCSHAINLEGEFNIPSSYSVHGLELNVPPEKFVEKTTETRTDIIGVSALFSTSIANTTEIIRVWRGQGIRDNFISDRWRRCGRRSGSELEFWAVGEATFISVTTTFWDILCSKRS